jgi:diguanylate cyclase (GGDEF)-like protein
MRHDSRTPDRRDHEALALLFASGATLALVSLVLPHGHRVAALPEVVTGSLGFPTALAVLLRRGRIPVVLLHTLLAGGTIIVTTGIYFGHGGGTAVAAAFFYVWVAMYAARCFSWRGAAAHVILAGAAYAVVLSVGHDPAAPGEWVLVMGTAVTVGIVVGTMRRQLLAQADTDVLTGVPNRAFADRALATELARARRSGTHVSVALLDLDGFKAVNDTHGHQAGDEILGQVARGWRRALRPTDLVARYGGDEFLVVMPGTGVEEATAILTRLHGADVGRFSYGLVSSDGSDSADHVVSKADQALYASKRERSLRRSPWLEGLPAESDEGALAVAAGAGAEAVGDAVAAGAEAVGDAVAAGAGGEEVSRLVSPGS